ncbi:hypoxanthine phosphoribosyltransferase [Candidatus Solincola sp.]|jgi:hypoxanthine phosphoribosyltransferase|nr:hypoxanthine phosphoribosyltransferase [Actinomycetota bacterium]MDI7251575.1 hypoxanthine phosphoribosyltransferase [Actinomycetota bacterium]
MDGVTLGPVLFTADAIAARVKEVSAEINRDYLAREEPGRDVVLVSVLKGGFIFLADLVRCLEIPVVVDFLAISGYGDRRTSAGVRILKDLSESIRGRDVLVVEDIVDTGLTLSYILRNLEARGPESVRVCTFLDRAVKRIVPVEIRYRCFEVGEEFVVGYGLDYNQKWRNLPHVHLLRGG